MALFLAISGYFGGHYATYFGSHYASLDRWSSIHFGRHCATFHNAYLAAKKIYGRATNRHYGTTTAHSVKTSWHEPPKDCTGEPAQENAAEEV